MTEKVRDIIKRLEADGWVLVRQTGSHRQFRHESKPGTVTVPGHPGTELPLRTVASTYRQAGLRR